MGAPVEAHQERVGMVWRPAAGPLPDVLFLLDRDAPIGRRLLARLDQLGEAAVRDEVSAGHPAVLALTEIPSVVCRELTAHPPQLRALVDEVLFIVRLLGGIELDDGRGVLASTPSVAQLPDDTPTDADRVDHDGCRTGGVDLVNDPRPQLFGSVAVQLPFPAGRHAPTLAAHREVATPADVDTECDRRQFLSRARLGVPARHDVVKPDDSRGILRGEVAGHLADVDGVVLAPLDRLLVDPRPADQHGRDLRRNILAGQVRRIECRYTNLVPERAEVADLFEIRCRIVRVPDRENATTVIGGKGIGGNPELRGNPTSLIENDKYVTSMDPLKRRFVMICRLSTESNKLAIDTPFGLIYPTG